MTNIIIAGAKGRMGQALLSCARRIPQIQVAAQLDRGQDLREVISGADVLIDFTSHEVTLPFAKVCALNHKAIVIGTTGHTEDERKEITQFASQIPVVLSANYSTGVNVLFWLTGKAAAILGPEFDVEIIEMHHRMKKDAPSGTAKTLAEVVSRERERVPADVLRHGRQGLTGERTASEIGMHSLRGGDVVGDHTVLFTSAGERLELTHKASNRETFAAGALRAAQWVVGKPPGLYDMQDVLGLR